MPSTMPTETPASREARSADEIRQWIVQELGVAMSVAPSSFDTAAPLDSLGVDSLAALGLTGGLAGWLDRDLPATLMWDYNSIDALAEGLADKAVETPPVVRPNVVDLQPSGDAKPAFFLPGLGGHPVTFAAMANQLGQSTPCYGLAVPGINGDQPLLTSVETIAAELLKSVRLIQPNGPYQLAGYSFGGLLAYEMAQQLLAAGETVSMLAIYDAFTPAGRRPRSRLQRAALHAWQFIRRGDRLQYLRARLSSRSQARGAAKVDLLADHSIATGPQDESAAYKALMKEVSRVNRAAAFAYQPKPYGGGVLVFRATKRADYEIFYKIDPTNGWGKLAAGGVTVIDLPGGHLGLLEGKRASFAADALRPYLSKV